MVLPSSSLRLDRALCAELLESPDTFGSVILAIAELTFGTEVVWGSEVEEPVDPLTLIRLLEDKFGIRLPEQSENKMNALLTCVLTNAFAENPDAFRMSAMALADGDTGDVSDTLLDNPTLDEIQWAEFEIGLWRDDDEDVEYSPQVMNILQAIIQQDAVDESESGTDDEPAHMLERLKLFNQQLRYCGITPAQIEQLGP